MVANYNCNEPGVFVKYGNSKSIKKGIKIWKMFQNYNKGNGSSSWNESVNVIAQN